MDNKHMERPSKSLFIMDIKIVHEVIMLYIFNSMEKIKTIDDSKY